MLVLYGHCPNSYRPPSHKRANLGEKKCPKSSWQALKPPGKHGCPKLSKQAFTPPPPSSGQCPFGNNTFQKGLPLVMRTNINIFSCGAVCVVFFYKNFRIFDASDPGAPSLPSVAQPLHLPRALRLLAQVGFSNGHDDSDLMWECGSVGWFEVPSLRKANLHSKTTGRDYWKDVAELHISLGLGLRHGSTVAIAPLTRWYSKHVTFC